MTHPSLILWILGTLSELLGIYSWIIVIAVVMSWLVAFNIINIHHPFARGVVRFLEAVTEPVFRPIRRVIPPIGGLDLSPLIVFFVIRFLIEYAIPEIASYAVV